MYMLMDRAVTPSCTCAAPLDLHFGLRSSSSRSNPGGVRLDEASDGVRKAVHALIKATCSPYGYEKVNGACLTNGFLGHLVNGRKVLNEDSFNFRLFGQPSTSAPWGYTFFGHHLCFNVFVCERDLVIGPTFFGAEPDFIDEGEHKGLRLFHTEEVEGLLLMQSLAPEIQKKAQVFESMQGDELPEDRCVGTRPVMVRR